MDDEIIQNVIRQILLSNLAVGKAFLDLYEDLPDVKKPGFKKHIEDLTDRNLELINIWEKIGGVKSDG